MMTVIRLIYFNFRTPQSILKDIYAFACLESLKYLTCKVFLFEEVITWQIEKIIQEHRHRGVFKDFRSIVEIPRGHCQARSKITEGFPSDIWKLFIINTNRLEDIRD